MNILVTLADEVGQRSPPDLMKDSEHRTRMGGKNGFSLLRVEGRW